ncbi:MAG: hypothetical protein KDK08_16595 [Rhizobiaceae bacterium]|nr:hypothetical protein [Rhizobiaceae bacterium]
MEDLATLVAANEEAAAAIASAYEVLLGGVPNVAGFTFVINSAIASGIADFNQENIFINVVNSLVQGNSEATAAFNALIAGQATLTDKVVAMYEALVPLSEQTPEGIAFLTRPDALQFYKDAVAERGIAGPNGDAIVALSAVLNVLYSEDIGIGDSVNDLLSAIADGSAQLPLSGDDFTPIEIADGTNYDGDDAGPATILTQGTDVFNGSVNDDLVQAPVEQTALLPIQTLNNTDQLNGGGGRDTLQAQLVNFFTVPAKLESIEVLTLDGAPGFVVPSVTLDVVNADSLDEINFRAPTSDITVNNVRTTLTSVSITDDVFGNDFTINHTGTGAAGDADALELTIRNLQDGFGGDTDFNTFGYEIYNLVSNGPVGGMTFTNDLELNDAAAEEIYVSGNASLQIDGSSLNISHLNIFDARELVGNDPAGDPIFVDAEFVGTGEVDVQGSEGGDEFEFDVGDGSIISVAGNGGDDYMEFASGATATATGGEGNDIFEFWANGMNEASFDADDSVDGGAGDEDQLWIVTNNGEVLVDGVGSNIVDVERIVHLTTLFGDADSDISLDASRSGSALELEFAGDYDNFDIVVTNLTNSHTVILSGIDVTDVTLDQAVDGVLDNLHHEFVDGADIGDDLIVGADIEALDIVVGATVAGNPSEIRDADQTDTDLRITGEGDLTIGIDSAYDHLDGLVDASMFTGDLTIHLGSGDQSVIGGSGDDLFVLETSGYLLLANLPDVIDLSVGGSDTVQFTSTIGNNAGFPTENLFENALDGTNYHRVVGFDIADDDLEILVGGGGIQLDNTATGASVNNTQDVAILDYVSGTNIDADGLVNYNFIKFTTAVPAAGGNAEAAFDAAIGLGVIQVQDNAEFLASLYDSSRGEMVLFTVDSGGDTAINTGDDIDVIGTVAMTYDDYLAFNGSNISFV